jgi:hypothetical protein
MPNLALGPLSELPLRVMNKSIVRVSDGLVEVSIPVQFPLSGMGVILECFDPLHPARKTQKMITTENLKYPPQAKAPRQKPRIQAQAPQLQRVA